MEITLPPELEKQVAAKVASGEYGSADEVASEGLRRLFSGSDDLVIIRAKIQEGVDALDRGESMGGDEFFVELDDYIEELTGKRP